MRATPLNPAPDLADRRVRKMIGHRLKHLRQQKEWTQTTLSEKAGIQPNTLRGIETGAPYRYNNLVRVCTALGTTPSVVAHTLEGSTDVWLNPLLKDLLSEDLRVAQRYHHASSEVRFWVDTTLKNRETPTGPPLAPDLVALAHRIASLDANRQQLIYLLLHHLEAQTLATATGQPRRRRRRNSSDDTTTTPSKKSRIGDVA
jgi:transcriptional regulator with XRE-family HTH domain